jgi:hypothetical protein
MEVHFGGTSVIYGLEESLCFTKEGVFLSCSHELGIPVKLVILSDLRSFQLRSCSFSNVKNRIIVIFETSAEFFFAGMKAQ